MAAVRNRYKPDTVRESKDSEAPANRNTVCVMGSLDWWRPLYHHVIEIMNIKWIAAGVREVTNFPKNKNNKKSAVEHVVNSAGLIGVAKRCYLSDPSLADRFFLFFCYKQFEFVFAI